MSKFIAIALLVIVVAGIVIVAQGVGIDLLSAPSVSASSNHCYNMLNAAGQVVQTVCH